MFRFVLVSCLVAAALASPAAIRRHQHIRNIFPNGKIVGGAVTTIDKVPWQVALEDTGYLFCGGSILSENFVLTAAHCTDGTPARYITVRYGTDTLETGGSTVKVSSLAQNPGFTQSNLDFDVSVLKLASAITLAEGTAQAISLREQEAAANETAQVSGWGTLNEGDFDLPARLHSVSVPVVDRDTCVEAYGDDIEVTHRMICAGEAGKDSCQGDSGGAITIGGAQVGVVSWGYGCAEEGYPGVYSNVANNEMRAFILENSSNEAKYV